MKSIPPFAAHHRAADDDWQTLLAHLIGVSALAKLFANKLKLGKLGELMGLLHDLGKYSLAFQAYLKSAVGALNQDEDEDWVDAASLKGKVDHSTAGAQLAWQALGSKGPMGIVAAQVASLCVASHHSGLIDCIAADEARFGEDGFTKRMNKADEKTHLDEAQRQADPALLARCAELLSDPGSIADLTGLLRGVAQINGAAKGTGPHATFQQLGLVVRFMFSCLIDADRIDTANFEHPRTARFRPTGAYTRWPTLLERLERHLDMMSPVRAIDGLRRDISNHCKDAALRPGGVYTLTVPTGGGKTLASLRFAMHHAERRNLDRIVYVIPFTSIIDQNAQVVRHILEPSSAPEDTGRVVLEHHGSVTPEQQTWREKILCENWDAPVVYTTMVQFLESLFGAGTRGARRMHQLANAVLVFDEVQTLPIQCVHLFNNAVNFLAEQCNSTVVLCTATQPLLHDASLTARGAVRLAEQHELMPDVHSLFEQLKRVDMRDRRKAGGWTHDEVANLALAEVNRTGSCLVIVNTKAAARQIFDIASASLNSDSIYHLSTDMCPAHRKEELSKVRFRLGQGEPILCISTQLIEAGVDVDFRVVIRFLAGLDSIAQAAGRCNRNGQPDPGVVHIVNPQQENLGKLPDISIGREKAQRVLDDYAQDPARYNDNLIGPKALAEYYRHYFFERQKEMSYSLPAKDLGHDDTLLELLSVNKPAVDEHTIRRAAPSLFFKQAFMTAGKAFKAIDAPTQGIVVPYGKDGMELINDLCAAFLVEKQFDLLRVAQQYTVNVFPHVLRKLKEAGAVHEVKPDTRILCLDPRYYSSRFGLSTEPVSPMETLNA
ncbi:MAG: CRISPR-associated helicase Cas3' [Pseudomonadota bacterium]|nr:CRISPR-associated helicase Cas3' [Pseudomonadota bacterium]